MKKIINNIIGLKRYFVLAEWYKSVPKKKLLTSNEALKHFGVLGKDYKADIMMMLAVIEYEFGREINYTPEEIGAVKHTLAKIMKFFKECAIEWEEYESKMAKKD